MTVPFGLMAPYPSLVAPRGWLELGAQRLSGAARRARFDQGLPLTGRCSSVIVTSGEEASCHNDDTQAERRAAVDLADGQHAGQVVGPVRIHPRVASLRGASTPVPERAS